MNSRLLYILLGLTGAFVLVVGAVLLINWQTQQSSDSKRETPYFAPMKRDSSEQQYLKQETELLKRQLEELKSQQEELRRQQERSSEEGKRTAIRMAETQVSIAQRSYDNAVTEWEAAKYAYFYNKSKFAAPELEQQCNRTYQAVLSAELVLQEAQRQLSYVSRR